MSPPLPTFSRPTISEIPAVALVDNRRDRRSVSAFSRIPSPLRCARPVSSTSGISLSKSMADSLSKTNELLNQEVNKLCAQVENLRKRCEFQELELQKSAKKAQEAMLLAAEESAKSKAAKEVIVSHTAQDENLSKRCEFQELEPQKSSEESARLKAAKEAIKTLTAQDKYMRKRCQFQELELQKSAKKAQEAMLLAAEESAKLIAAKEVIKFLEGQIKDMARRLPPGVYDAENLKPAYLPNCLELNGIHYPDANGESHSRSDSINSSSLASPTGLDSAVINVTQGPTQYVGDPIGTNETNSNQLSHGLLTSNGRDIQSVVRMLNGNGGGQASSSTVPETVGSKESEPFQDGDSMKSRNSALAGNGNQVEAERVEQYKPGVYITLVAHRDGTTDLIRVRFSRKRFGERQAEKWWSENRAAVYERYNVLRSDKSLDSGQAACSSEGAISPFPNFCNIEGMEVVH